MWYDIFEFETKKKFAIDFLSWWRSQLETTQTTVTTIEHIIIGLFSVALSLSRARKE